MPKPKMTHTTAAQIVGATTPDGKRKTRNQIMTEYAERMKLRGHKQVKVWVPADMVPWLHRIADDARSLDEMGFNPLEKLPAVLIPRGDDDA